MPRSRHELADHPLICEIRFDGASDPWVSSLRSGREPRQLALLLTLLVPGLRLADQSAQGWVLTPTLSTLNPEAPTPELQSEYAQQGYFVPGMLNGPDSLSEQDGLPDINLGPVPRGIEAGATLTLREDMAAYLDAYIQLTPDDRRKLLRAAYWLHLAGKVFASSHSASFQSLVQAVEALTTVPPGQPKCPECDRVIGVGPTRLFQEFVAKYAPPTEDSEDERTHKLLYETRSLLTHGNSLLEVDEETGFVTPTPARITEGQLHGKAAEVCRAAVLGWLRSHAPDGAAFE
ncbi:hypothetical protein ACIQMR_30900 [Streptomyces sp. NPDC091376]|uniref:hypothetical protein n=1 Tax=Streptomyces sp. NPDC091376 TaxID=3365994 RepID=UPI00382CB032